jgi:hypothetical protein
MVSLSSLENARGAQEYSVSASYPYPLGKLLRRQSQVNAIYADD